MKSSLQQQDDLLSTTTEEKNKIQVKENKHLFNHIGKLAADHDVTVSNTMIKITYKKALKDQNALDGTVNHNTDSLLNTGNITPLKTMNLCSSDISPKSPTQTEEKKVFHSTPKTDTADAEKNKKHINGLTIFIKQCNPEGMSPLEKVQTASISRAESTFNPEKVKTVKTTPEKVKTVKTTPEKVKTVKTTPEKVKTVKTIPEKVKMTKSELVKKFPKNKNGLVKPRGSIIQKNCGDSKKVKFSELSDTKIKKLENEVKKETGVNKKGIKKDGMKLKLELDVLVRNKKLKISGSKIKEIEASQSVEEIRKGGSKRRVMLVDPDLPTGWTRFMRTKNKGSPNEQYVVYIVNPQGKKFRYKWKLRKYLEQTNSPLDANQFFFGVYQRPKTSTPSVIEVDEERSKNNEGPEEMSSEDLNEIESEPSPEPENRIEEEDDKSHESSSNERKIMLFDPDLPFGWKRIIHTNSVNGRKQVHIISPDGKIFRRRYRLNEYLVKHQYTHNLDRFHFGLYPKKEGSAFDSLCKGTEDMAPNSVKMHKPEDSGEVTENAMISNNGNASDTSDLQILRDDSKEEDSNSPLYDDPNLPKGWKRFIKIRSCGDSAGRMEVIIVSPDGIKHRSKKHLEQYLMKKQLNYKPEDFDFTVFGKSNPKSHPPSTSAQEPEPEREPKPTPPPTPNNITFSNERKKFTDKPVPELDINSLKEAVRTPEGHLLNTVAGMMMCGGLSSPRSERRLKLPRREHEKQLKSYLSSENESCVDGSDVPTYWVQTLVKCRSDFRILEPAALPAIADATKEFIKNVSLKALNNSKHPEKGLMYEDIAELVDSAECLSFLKTLIPKKITFREYIKLNRPKYFKSFT